MSEFINTTCTSKEPDFISDNFGMKENQSEFIKDEIDAIENIVENMFPHRVGYGMGDKIECSHNLNAEKTLLKKAVSRFLKSSLSNYKSKVIEAMPEEIEVEEGVFDNLDTDDEHGFTKAIETIKNSGWNSYRKQALNNINKL